jgi:hypothetical protein
MKFSTVKHDEVKCLYIPNQNLDRRIILLNTESIPRDELTA